MTEEELPSGEQASDGPRFEDFDLAPAIQKAVARVGYETPSPFKDAPFLLCWKGVIF